MKMRFPLKAFAASCCALALFCQVARGEIPIRQRTPAERAQFGRAIQRTMKTSLDSFQPFMSPEQRMISAQVELDAPPTQNFFDAFATKEDGPRRIVLGVGFVESLEMVEDAAILMFVYQFGDLDALRRYVDYVADAVTANGSAFSVGKSLQAELPYWAFVHEPEARVLEVYANQDYQGIRLRTRMETLALITGHELGHHVLHHLEARPGAGLSKQQRADFIRPQEVEADEFGLRVASAAGNHLFFSWMPFALFASLEGSPTGMSDHPPGYCRGALVWRKAIALALASSGNSGVSPAARQALLESQRLNEDFLASSCRS